MTLDDILQLFQDGATSLRAQGDRFEVLIRRWLLTDSTFADRIDQAWLWADFPFRDQWGGHDIGIDIVVRTVDGEWWAVQCKFFAKGTVFTKEMVDSFISASGKSFRDETGQTQLFSDRFWVFTHGTWGANALATIEGQTIPFHRIGYEALAASNADWDKLYNGASGEQARKPGLQPLKHQLQATQKAYEHYVGNGERRGKLIMACGTGKTFTSLYMVQTLYQNEQRPPLVLFLVPSIALLGQTYSSWKANARGPMRAICVCSDSKVAGKKDDDQMSQSIDDLLAPVSTDPDRIAAQLIKYANAADGLTVVFSTYQSIEAVHKAQQTLLERTGGDFGVFDFAICDEAHRTASASAGSRAAEGDESAFVRIHDDDYVRASRRMYMTATPKIFSASLKARASQDDAVLYSMDDEKVFGKEFFRVNFSYAVREGLLTDYKVWVLTVNEADLPDDLARKARDPQTKEINFDDTAKLIGCINGLSKQMMDERGVVYDPAELRVKMRRAVAFCQEIGSEQKAGSSKNIAKVLPMVSQIYHDSLETDDERREIVNVQARHIDGSMDMGQRDEILSWLKQQEPEQDNVCKVVTNVRCLSEGVDVPSLDSVLFLSARKSQVEVVQSVGRVMRNFRRGQEGGKEWGYIIIPVVVPVGVSPEEALDNDRNFDVVWKILNALRAHDDHFEAQINCIALDGRPRNIRVGNGGKRKKLLSDRQTGIGQATDDPEAHIGETPEQKMVRQLTLNFGETNAAIYARMVQKVGDRMYWDLWSRKVGALAQKFISRINRFLDEGQQVAPSADSDAPLSPFSLDAESKRDAQKAERYRAAFDEYLTGLRDNINPAVSRQQAVEMLAQHMITGPVFDALFPDYQFQQNNPVSRSMQAIVDLLRADALGKDTEELDEFYKTVSFNVGQITTLDGKQTLIKTLYEKFFKGAFPTMVEKMGIVYTPVPCVDFILRQTDRLMQQEFGQRLSDEGVSILDPFAGTGTFVARLLADDGTMRPLIRAKDVVRKYRSEIFCNEILLMAYYIADVNIESVFHERALAAWEASGSGEGGQEMPYLTFDNISLTDTFQLAERQTTMRAALFGENRQKTDELSRRHFRVIVGNPPYSVGQKSANDNAQNEHYPALEARIASTYVAQSTANLKNSLYDSYVKAFRWASDKVRETEEGGIVGFISNGSWLDNNAFDGFRKCIEAEFTDIYVLNLRGNQRTSGELSRKEGGKIFGSGSRTPVAITFLVYNPARLSERRETNGGKAVIHYHDIGDYLSREEKLSIVSRYATGKEAVPWQTVTPNQHGDWLTFRDDSFSELTPLAPEKKFQQDSQSVFETYSNGVKTNRDAWCYNYSRNSLSDNMRKMIAFYNEQREKLASGEIDEVDTNPTKIAWTVNLNKYAEQNKEVFFDESSIRVATYRPFSKQLLYNNKDLCERPGLWSSLFPTPHHKNLVIGVSGVGVMKPFSCIITDQIPDLEIVGKNQCFPLYWYESREEAEKRSGAQGSLFGNAVAADGFDEWGYRRRDGVTDWMHAFVCKRYGAGKGALTKEMIFYAVYSLLHDEGWRTRYAANLRKELPHIGLPETIDGFLKEEKRGRALAALHLGYESEAAPEEVVVRHAGETVAPDALDALPMEHLCVTKMRFPSKERKETIVVNGWLTVEGIPAEAYQYVVNGRSAIEWVMERYAVSTDKASGIVNDPNLWAAEQGEPAYIVRTLLGVIGVSLKTVRLLRE